MSPQSRYYKASVRTLIMDPDKDVRKAILVTISLTCGAFPFSCEGPDTLLLTLVVYVAVRNKIFSSSYLQLTLLLKRRNVKSSNKSQLHSQIGTAGRR